MKFKKGLTGFQANDWNSRRVGLKQAAVLPTIRAELTKTSRVESNLRWMGSTPGRQHQLARRNFLWLKLVYRHIEFIANRNATQQLVLLWNVEVLVQWRAEQAQCALRAGTQACHQRLEARLPFFRDDFDLSAYRRLMQAYYGFHAPLQALLTDHQGSERAKTTVLEHDLQALGLSRAEVAALPRCEALPATADEASVLGVMYVIEGSTLGGQVLKRAMAERLGIDGDHGARFLDVYGPLTGAQPCQGLWLAAAAAAGAPLGHDFCAINLSDNMKPWELVEKRLRLAAEAMAEGAPDAEGARLGLNPFENAWPNRRPQCTVALPIATAPVSTDPALAPILTQSRISAASDSASKARNTVAVTPATPETTPMASPTIASGVATPKVKTLAAMPMNETTPLRIAPQKCPVGSTRLIGSPLQ